MKKQESLSIAQPHPAGTDAIQKLGLIFASIGILILFVAWGGYTFQQNGLFLTLALLTICGGTVIYAIRTYLTKPAGISNNHVFQMAFTNRGVWAWMAGIILTGFYILLYWFPQYLGLAQDNTGNKGLAALFDPLSKLLTGAAASQWFVYGTIYTLLICSLGFKFILKYRHNRYQIIRTISVMIAQLFLAYLIPEILEGFSDPTHYFAKFLPLLLPILLVKDGIVVGFVVVVGWPKQQEILFVIYHLKK